MHKPSHPYSYRIRRRHVKHREIFIVPPRFQAREKEITEDVNRVVSPILADGVHGYRKRHSIHTAVQHVERLRGRRLAFDIKEFFPSIDQAHLEKLVNRLDPSLWQDIRPFLGHRGIRTGVRFSPMLSNLYLNNLDHRFRWVRYCDNIMIVGPDPERVFRRAQRHLKDIGLTCHKIEIDPTSFLRQPLKEVIRPKARVIRRCPGNAP